MQFSFPNPYLSLFKFSLSQNSIYKKQDDYKNNKTKAVYSGTFYLVEGTFPSTQEVHRYRFRAIKFDRTNKTNANFLKANCNE